MVTVIGKIAPNIVCCIYIYLISNLNGTHIVAIAPRLELNSLRFAPTSP